MNFVKVKEHGISVNYDDHIVFYTWEGSIGFCLKGDTIILSLSNNKETRLVFENKAEANQCYTIMCSRIIFSTPCFKLI